MNIRRSDGTLEEYSVDTVKKGIVKAYVSVNEDINELIIDSVIGNIYVYEGIASREIRRHVENALMGINKKVARAYFEMFDAKDIENKRRKKHNDFIQAYLAASNAATGSKFDANANVVKKNVVTMGQELYKKDNIEQNRYILYDRIKSLYSKKLADRYIYDIETHRLYKHDETAIPGMPYTYSAKEVIEVQYKGRHLMLPFDLLWNVIDEDAVLVNDVDNVYQKKADDLFVKDRNNQFTKVSVITKKERKRDLVRVKTAFGEDVVVTDNHPMIVNIDDVNDCVDAINSNGCKQYKIDDKIVFHGNAIIDLCGCPNIEHYTDVYCMTYSHDSFKRHLTLDEKFGYFVGFFVGDGNYNNNKNNGSIVITQKNRETLEKLNNILFESLGITGYIRYKRDKFNCYSLTVSNDVLWWLLDDIFMIQDKAENKTLPINILETNEDFAKGVLSGLIDSDGTVNDCQFSIRLSSRSAIIQTTNLLRHFGYGVGNTIQRLPFSNNTSYKTNYTLWGVNTSVRTDSVKFDMCEKLKNVRISDSALKYHKDGETNITSVEVINENDSFLGLNDFIYDITTETRTFACNNLLVHNCVAVTLYPFLTDGLTQLGGPSKAPKSLKSFCGEFINLVYSISSQFAGAVATPEFLMYMDYFIRKDYGQNYLEKLDTIVELTEKPHTLEYIIENYFQQIVHSMNMPAGNRGYQSVFWNVGYFDYGYFKGVFGDFRFPDGSEPKWETLSWLQKKFMKWFNSEREKYILTFPVETMACLTDGHDLVDEEYAEFTAQMWADGHSFFTYLSDSPDSLSSCCFSKDTKVLWKTSTDGVHLTTLGELHNTKWEPYKKNLTIFHNGSWVKGKSISLPNRKMYKVVTENNKEFIMTDNHINVTFDGEKTTENLTTSDYLMFNTQVLNAIPENDEHLTYDMGFVVGAFLGDGSFGSEINGTIYETNFSQNVKNYEKMMFHTDECLKQIGSNNVSRLGSVYNNVYPVRVSSKDLVSLIQRWTNWERGTYAYNKKLNLNCLLQSVEFRKGILDGWYHTDGGNSNRCYTTSKELAEEMECLITSLGMNSIINIVERFDDDTYIRGEKINHNYPLYCVRWYSELNNRVSRNDKHTWKKKNNSIFFKIKSIDVIEYSDNVYCIERNDANEPYFTLPCGLITHNCRLRNSLKNSDDDEHNHTTHQFSMGTASVATGSKSVMTMNLNRIIQNSVVEFFDEHKDIDTDYVFGEKYDLCNSQYKEQIIEKIKSNITEFTENIHKYQTAFNSIIKDFFEANMLDVYSAGFINLRKQYLTIGVNGLTDAAEFLNITVGDNAEYQNFVNVILETINISNGADKTRDCMFNTEFVPGENLSNKNYNWDKADGYYVSDDHIMYSSYFFNPEDDMLSVLKKMKLHGTDYVQYLDGGSACHINIKEHLSKEQYRNLLKYAASVGCNYFTFNVRNTVCNDCGYISKHDIDECPHCHSTNVDKLTRIIGYLKRVSSFAEPRQIEEHMRHYNETAE